jgi:hypothetical protein
MKTKEFRISITENGYIVDIAHSISRYRYTFNTWKEVIEAISKCNRLRNLHPPLVLKKKGGAK